MVTSAVHTDHTDNGEDDVLALYILGQLTGQVNLNSLGNLEPGGAAGHSTADIGLAHAGGQRVQRAIGTGVGVRTDNDFTGSYQAFIGQQSMLDTHLTNLKVVGNVMLASEVTHLLAHSSGFNVLAG